MRDNNKRTATIHGVTVTQMNLQGNWYTPVDGRVKIAEQADPAQVRREGAGYHVVSVQIMQVGDRWAYHCMVEYPAGSGVVKPGTDFIDMKDSAGIAKAETSAIGRALGLHGIACEESIASAEEMERATDNTTTARQRTPQPNLTAQPKHAPASTSGDSRPPQRDGTQDTPHDAAKPATSDPDAPATVEQRERMRKYRDALSIADRAIASTDNALTVAQAEARICAYIEQWKKRQMRKSSATPATGEHDLSTLGNGGGRH